MQESVEFNELLLTNLFEALEAKGGTLRQQSLAIGANERYLAELKSKRSKIKAESLAWICAKHDLDPSKIMGFGDKVALTAVSPTRNRSSLPVAGRPFDLTMNISTMMREWHLSDGLLSSMSPGLSAYFDLFAEPIDGELAPVRMGKKSMAGVILETTKLEAFKKALESTAKSILDRVAEHHYAAIQGKPILTIESIDVVWPGERIVAYVYNRLLLPVRNDAGVTFILSYSEYVRHIEQSADRIRNVRSINTSE